MISVINHGPANVTLTTDDKSHDAHVLAPSERLDFEPETVGDIHVVHVAPEEAKQGEEAKPADTEK